MDGHMVNGNVLTVVNGGVKSNDYFTEDIRVTEDAAERKSGIRKRSIVSQHLHGSSTFRNRYLSSSDQPSEIAGSHRKGSKFRRILGRILERKDTINSKSNRNGSLSNSDLNQNATSIRESYPGKSDDQRGGVFCKIDEVDYLDANDCVKALPNDHPQEGETIIVTRSFESNPEAVKRWRLLKNTVPLLGNVRGSHSRKVTDEDTDAKTAKIVRYGAVRGKANEKEKEIEEEAEIETNDSVKALPDFNESNQVIMVSRNFEFNPNARRNWSLLKNALLFSNTKRDQVEDNDLNSGTKFQSGLRRKSIAVVANERRNRTVNNFDQDADGDGSTASYNCHAFQTEETRSCESSLMAEDIAGKTRHSQSLKKDDKELRYNINATQNESEGFFENTIEERRAYMHYRSNIEEDCLNEKPKDIMKHNVSCQTEGRESQDIEKMECPNCCYNFAVCYRKGSETSNAFKVSTASSLIKESFNEKMNSKKKSNDLAKSFEAAEDSNVNEIRPVEEEVLDEYSPKEQITLLKTDFLKSNMPVHDLDAEKTIEIVKGGEYGDSSIDSVWVLQEKAQSDEKDFHFTSYPAAENISLENDYTCIKLQQDSDRSIQIKNSGSIAIHRPLAPVSVIAKVINVNKAPLEHATVTSICQPKTMISYV